MSDDANIAFESRLNELDVTRGGRAAGLGRTTAMIAAGALAAAVFGSGPLRDWAFEVGFGLDPDTLLGVVTGGLSDAADAWHGWMEQLGATGLHEAARRWLEEIRYG